LELVILKQMVFDRDICWLSYF